MRYAVLRQSAYLWQTSAVKWLIKEAKDADFFRWSLAGLNYQKGINSEAFDFFLFVHLFRNWMLILFALCLSTKNVDICNLTQCSP